MCYRGAHAVVYTFYIDRENFVEILLRGAFQIADVGDPRIVNQNVKAAILEYLMERGVDGLVLGYIAAKGFRVSAGGPNFGGDALGSFLVDVEQAYAGTAGGKSLRNRAPYAACRPGNCRELAIQAKRV
jgi:hypothetical protein